MHRFEFRRLAAFALCVGAALPAQAQPLSYPGTPVSPAIAQGGNARQRSGEVWIGPMPYWTNVRALGAAADCSTDAAPAFQAALDKAGVVNGDRTINTSTIYVPAGCYSIRRPLTVRSRTGIRVTGDDPATTTLRWDGPRGGTMMHAFGCNFGRWERLTFDGHGGLAGTGLLIDWDGKVTDPNELFPSPQDVADVIFQDFSANCLQAGSIETNPANANTAAAEGVVFRSRFLRCGNAGFFAQDYNTLDWAIHDSYFADDYAGISNGTDKKFGIGGFHAYNNVFVRSRYGDIAWTPFVQTSLRGNWSSGSQHFVMTPFEAAYAPLLLQGNTVVNAKDNPLKLFPSGPYTILDNTLATDPALGDTPAILVDSPDGGKPQLLAVGNTFTTPNWFFNYNPANPVRLARQESKVVAANAISTAQPLLPDTRPKFAGRVIRVTTPTGAAIQTAINEAARSTESPRPIVYLTEDAKQYDNGYLVAKTIEVPANIDLEIAGDGRATTLLTWTGPTNGTMFHLAGPSRAVLSDFRIHMATYQGGLSGTGILADHADQAGGRILIDGSFQNSDSGEALGLLVEGLDNTFLQATDVLGNSVRVVGGPQGAANARTAGRVNMFGVSSGASRSQSAFDVQNGGRLHVSDMWYESSAATAPTFDLTGSGFFTLETQLSAINSFSNRGATVVNGFNGNVAILNSVLNANPIAIHGTPATAVLVTGWAEGNPSDGRNHIETDGDTSLVAGLNNVLIPASGPGRSAPNSGPVNTVGAVGWHYLHTMLAPSRIDRIVHWGPLNAGLTDLRLIRLGFDLERTAIHITR